MKFRDQKKLLGIFKGLQNEDGFYKQNKSSK